MSLIMKNTLNLFLTNEKKNHPSLRPHKPDIIWPFDYVKRALKKRLFKDNGPASKEPSETHNECMLHCHKFHKVL